MSRLKVRFGKRIKSLRKLAGLTQEELAERASISIDFLGLVERGLRGLSFETIEKLSVALNVDIFELFKFDN